MQTYYLTNQESREEREWEEKKEGEVKALPRQSISKLWWVAVCIVLIFSAIYVMLKSCLKILFKLNIQTTNSWGFAKITSLVEVYFRYFLLRSYPFQVTIFLTWQAINSVTKALVPLEEVPSKKFEKITQPLVHSGYSKSSIRSFFIKF